MRIQAKAKIQFTVEIDAGGPWDSMCAISQMFKQAQEEGIKNFTNALKSGTIAGPPNIRVIGEPKVIGIITESVP